MPTRTRRAIRHASLEGIGLVEMVLGIALIVIAALEIWFIVRTVQANMRHTIAGRG